MQDFGSETFELSVGEFNQLQQQIVNLKTELHELRMYKEQQESKNKHKLRPLSLKKDREPKVIADFDDPLSSNMKSAKVVSNDNESKKKIGLLEKKMSRVNEVNSKLEKEKGYLEKEVKRVNLVKSKLEKEKVHWEMEVKRIQKENQDLVKNKDTFGRENNELINTLSKINLQHQGELKKREQVYEGKRRELERSIETFKSDQESLISSLREKYVKEKEKMKIDSDLSWRKKLDNETLYLKKEIKQLNEKSEKILTQEKKKVENFMKKNMSRELKSQSEKYEKKMAQEKRKLEVDLKKRHIQEMKNLGEKSDRRYEGERKKYEIEKKKIEAFFQEKIRKEVKMCQIELNKRFDMEKKKHVTQMKSQGEKLEHRLNIERKKFEIEREKLKKELDFFKKKKNSHKKKKNESRFQVKQLNIILENVRKDLSTSKEEIVNLKASDSKKKKKIEGLEYDREDLGKDRNKLIQELQGKVDIQKQIVSQKEVLEKRLLSEKQKLSKSRKKNDKKRTEIERLRKIVKREQSKLFELQEKYDRDYISMFVNKSLSTFHIHHLSSMGQSLSNEHEKLNSKNTELEEQREKNEIDIRNLKNSVEDLQTENQIAQKHNIREIRELKKHLNRYKSVNERLERKNRELSGGSGGRISHVRTHSSPSDPSSRLQSVPRNRKTSGPSQDQNTRPSKPSPLSTPTKKNRKKNNNNNNNGKKVVNNKKKVRTTTTPSSQQQQQQKNIIMKKKKILGLKPSPKIRKKIIGGGGGGANIGNSMSGGINSSDDLKKQLRYYARKVKVLEDQNVVYSEKLEQKTKIISDYMKREKLGRIHDLMTPITTTESVESEHNKKGVLKIFSKKKKNKKKKNRKKKNKKKKKNEIVDPVLLQKIMEETLVKNIQLQDNLKTMGDEVDRLMKENEKMKKLDLKKKKEEIEKEDEEEEEGEK